jgi:hypothetical protein
MSGVEIQPIGAVFDYSSLPAEIRVEAQVVQTRSRCVCAVRSLRSAPLSLG